MTIQLAAALSLILLLAAPTPGPAAVAPEEIVRELVDVPGAAEPHTPPEYNRARAFRYHAPGAPAPAVVLVLIPGLNSGPNTLDVLARALIAGHGPGLEVWAVAPRATLLQDRRGIVAALAYGNPDFALGYYYGALPIDGHTFHLLKGSEVTYMAYWGLDVHLRDVHALIREVRRRDPAARVVLGGHSLGGVFAAAYAGYDFASIPGATPSTAPPAPPDIGARGISGLLFVDGLPLHVPLRLSPYRYLHGIRIPSFIRIPGLENLITTDPSKRVAPFTKTSKLARTQDSILVDVVSVYAYLRPHDRSSFPFYPRRGLAITNSALVAAIFSDQMQPDRFVRAAVEVPVGVFQRVPDPTGINSSGLLDLQSGRPAPGHPLIDLPEEEGQPGVRVHLRQLLGAILRPGGEFTEWYFPWRIVLDLGLADNLDTSDAFSRQYMNLTHMRDTDVPMLIIGAGHGLVQSVGATEFYLRHVATPRDRIAVRIFPGYSHLDVEDADPNPVVSLILTWLNGVVH
jgi:pimeloyl-ACP methyl ester carboxylesterase